LARPWGAFGKPTAEIHRLEEEQLMLLSEVEVLSSESRRDMHYPGTIVERYEVCG
jgi:hypothetical protein